MRRISAALVAMTMLALQCAPMPAYADNQMGYRLLSQQEASGLPRNGGALGMDIERAQQISDGGMTFDLLRVKQVRRGSPGAQAGFNSGDQIIAVDGRVFPTIAAFGAYVGSMQPGDQISVDYIPAGGGPQQAQRVSVSVGGARTAQGLAQDRQSQPPAPGMSTGTKVAIGVGAAALFGCYELGCFSRSKTGPTAAHPQQMQPGVQLQR